MSPVPDLKERENQASNNPGDRWRTSITHKNEGAEDIGSESANANRDDVQDQEQDKQAQSYYNDQQDNKKKRGKLMGGKGPLMAIFGGLSMTLVIVGFIANMFSSILINIKETLFNDHQSNSSRTNKVYGDAMRASMFTQGKCVGKIQILCKFQTMSDRQIKKLERAGFRVEPDPDKNAALPGRQKIKRITFPDGSVANNAREFHTLANASPTHARWVRYATLGKTSYYLNSKFDKILGKFKTDKSKKLTGKTKEDNDSDVNKNTNGVDSKGKDDAKVKDEAKKKAGDDVTNKLKTDGVGNITKRVSGKMSWLAAPVVLGCGAYNMSHLVTAYAKKYHIEQMVKYSMIFLNTADRIKDQGDISPEQASYAGELFTDVDTREKITDPSGKETTNPSLGETATDAQAYKIAAHGDQSDLTPEAQKFKANGYTSDKNTSWLGRINDITKSIEVAAAPFNPAHGNPLDGLFNQGKFFGSLVKNGGDFFKTAQEFATNGSTSIDEGREAIRYLCIKGEKAALTGYIAFCAAQAINAASVVVGNAEGSVGWASLIGCVAAAACQVAEFAPVPKDCSDATQFVGEKALELADKLGITDAVLKYIQDSVVGSFLKYTDVGNAVGAGEAFMGEKTANGYGLRPAKDTEEAKNFVASTNKDMEMDDKIAFEDAQKTPFDLKNPYSFLSTVVRSAGLYFDSRTPVYSALGSIISIVPSSLTSGQTAKAYYSQPVQTPDQRYNCDDPDLINIGIKNGDKFCNTSGITPNAELEKGRQQATDDYPLIEKTIEYMTKEQPANEAGGGTLDDSFCDIPGGDALFGGVVGMATSGGGDCSSAKEKSKQRSINDDGSTVSGSQYEKYIKYCTEDREWPWGTFGEEVQEAKTTRDLDWFTGKQCLSDSTMMQNFRTYYNLCAQQATMDDTASCFEDTSSAPTTASGDACSIMNNPNIVYVNPGTKEGLKELCETGKATNSCGQPFTINPMLFNVITTLSSKYKIWLNNFGFKQDRFSCDSGQHPKGNAIDLNGIEIVGGGGKAGGPDWGGITYSDPAQVKVIESYASDWLNALPRDRGGVGQKGCGGGRDSNPAFNPTFPAGSINVNGAAFFEDSCDHLHIDIRNRGNLNAV